MTDLLRARPRALGVALVCASLALSACATQQTASKCPVPDGAKCMSTEDVYSATNANDHVPKPANTSHKEGTSDPTVVAPTVQTVDSATAPAAPAHAIAATTPTQPALVPTAYVTSNSAAAPTLLDAGARVVRAPARVLTVYISPWQDDQGDLHLSQRVMTEVIGRRWKIPGYSNIATVSPASDDVGLLPPGTLAAPPKSAASTGGASATAVAAHANQQ